MMVILKCDCHDSDIFGPKRKGQTGFVSSTFLPSITPFSSCPGGAVPLLFLCFHHAGAGACVRSKYYTLHHLLLILSWFPKGYWNAPCGCLIPVALLPVFQAVPCSWATAGGPMLGCYTLYISIPRPHYSYIRTITDFTEMKFLPSFRTDASVWVKIKSKNK